MRHFAHASALQRIVLALSTATGVLESIGHFTGDEAVEDRGGLWLEFHHASHRLAHVDALAGTSHRKGWPGHAARKEKHIGIWRINIEIERTLP